MSSPPRGPASNSSRPRYELRGFHNRDDSVAHRGARRLQVLTLPVSSRIFPASWRMVSSCGSADCRPRTAQAGSVRTLRQGHAHPQLCQRGASAAQRGSASPDVTTQRNIWTYVALSGRYRCACAHSSADQELCVQRQGLSSPRLCYWWAQNRFALAMQRTGQQSDAY